MEQLLPRFDRQVTFRKATNAPVKDVVILNASP
jgi:hypothetical protein